MGDRLVPSPQRQQKLVRDRLEPRDQTAWKSIRSYLPSGYSCSVSKIPSKPNTPSEPASD